MKLFLLVSFAFAATLYVVSAQQLPDTLIQRARQLIREAEEQLEHHHRMGRQHLTQVLEHEIEAVRELERELMALEQHKHMELEHVFAVEERLLHAENKLIEALVEIVRQHERERENLHFRPDGE